MTFFPFDPTRVRAIILKSGERYDVSLGSLCVDDRSFTATLLDAGGDTLRGPRSSLQAYVTVPR